MAFDKNNDKCEICGWDFKANSKTCPNCNARTVTVEGVCSQCGRVEQILFHPVKHPIAGKEKSLLCENCKSVEFKDVKITIL